jgi:hypothetical protein
MRAQRGTGAHTFFVAPGASDSRKLSGAAAPGSGMATEGGNMAALRQAVRPA